MNLRGGRRAIIYARVSTDAQERDGTSLETQERACRGYAEANGCVIVECIRDAASGFSLDRTGIERVRRLLRDGKAEVLVAYAVDRLSRNQNQIGVLFDEAQSAGAQLEFVTERFEDTAIGRFILAARAFIAEVEREKIAERTMRGKAERARSGRLPQGTGKGCYGYRYDATTGRRVLDTEQAAIVRRIFLEFVQGSPLVAIVNRLNGESIPTFMGKHWSCATVFHLLHNETYTGRTVYRRTKADKIRDPRTGQRHRRVSVRDTGEWIEVDGATPAIINSTIFEAAHLRLSDPERLRQGRRVYAYALSGRLRCRRCGRAMVGQTLRGEYRYYRCRAAFAGAKHERCLTRYVHADALEAAIRQKISDLLADERLILAEYEYRAETLNGGGEQQKEREREIEHLDRQRLRLLKLYQMGEIDDAYLEAELASLRAKREKLQNGAEDEPIPLPPPTAEDLRRACERVRAWIECADGDDLLLLLEALQIRISAETEQAEVEGVLPMYAPACSDTDVRSMVINKHC